MKNKEITENSLKKVKELIQDVQKMSQEKFQETLDKMVRFHQYSLYNQILLAFAGCSQVAGYKKWKELGRTVKKGGRAVWILAPWLMKVEIEDKVEGKEEEKKKILKGFFSVPVFDISQTEGKAVEGNMTTRSDLSFEVVKKFAHQEGFEVVFKPLEVIHGGFIDEEKNITLNSNLAEKDWTGTLIHELAHGLLGQNGTPQRVREQQAETTTYLVCKVLGIERKSEFYLKSWGLSEDILKDFGKVDKVAKKLIAALRGEENGARNAATTGRSINSSTREVGAGNRTGGGPGGKERLSLVGRATVKNPRGLPRVQAKQPPRPNTNDPL